MFDSLYRMSIFIQVINIYYHRIYFENLILTNLNPQELLHKCFEFLIYIENNIKFISEEREINDIIFGIYYKFKKGPFLSQAP